MVHIHLITNCVTSRLVVHKLLTKNHSVLYISFKQTTVEKPDKLVLIEVGTAAGDIYLFDIKENPDLMFDGELWRVLETTEIIKVAHDCRYHSLGLRQQYNVTLANIFDTQAAYSLLMMQKQLPPRQVILPHLYEKYGDSKQKYMPMLQACLAGKTGHFWSKRPMCREMIHQAAIHVQVLHSLYHNIKIELDKNGITSNKLSELCYAYIHGQLKERRACLI